jgi:hypothetical protein
VPDLTFDDRGVVVNLRKSKTDQEGQGAPRAPRSGAVVLSNAERCPVTALREWVRVADITKGPVFRTFALPRERQEGSERLQESRRTAAISLGCCGGDRARWRQRRFHRAQPARGDIHGGGAEEGCPKSVSCESPDDAQRPCPVGTFDGQRSLRTRRSRRSLGVVMLLSSLERS